MQQDQQQQQQQKQKRESLPIYQEPINMTTNSTNRMRFFMRFLIWCSGAQQTILVNLPLSEQIKHQTIGSTILITGIFAGLSMVVLFQELFSNTWAGIVVGFFWGLLIFNIDRTTLINIEVKMHGSGSRIRTFATKTMILLPRILLSIAIGILISMPISLQLYKNEINRYVKGEQFADRARISVEISRLESKIVASEQLLISKDKEVSFLKEALLTESEGNLSKTGYGPIARSLMNKYVQSIEEREKFYGETQSHIAGGRKELAELKMKERSIVEAISTPITITSRLIALKEIKKSSRILFALDLVITMFFIALYILPLLIKVIAMPGKYESILIANELLPVKQIKTLFVNAVNQVLDESYLKPGK